METRLYHAISIVGYRLGYILQSLRLYIYMETRLAIADNYDKYGYIASLPYSRNCRNYRSSQVGSGLQWKKFEPALTISFLCMPEPAYDCRQLQSMKTRLYRNDSDFFWSRRKNHDRLGYLRCNYLTRFYYDLCPKELHDGERKDKRVCSWSTWNIGSLNLGLNGAICSIWFFCTIALISKQ